MIRGWISRSSSAAKWLPAVSRTYTTSNPPSSQHEGALAANAGDRVTKPRSKIEARNLPVSPFMDPVIIAAREKHRERKLPASKNPTAFQRKLARNPYALALATPVRACQILDVRLPKYFLQDFDVMAHPETREPWWVPTSLRKEFNDAEAVLETAHEGSSLESERPEGEVDALDPNSPLPSQPPSAKHQSISLGPGVYTLSRKALIASMTKPRSGWARPPWKYFFTGSIMRSMMAKKVREHSSWRMDMENFVLDLMRRRVVESLVYLVRRKRGFISGCVDWKDASMAKRQQAMVLWTGEGIGGVIEDEISEVGVEVEVVHWGEYAPREMRQDGPPEFSTLTIGKDRPHMVPVYNLRKLLGLEHLERLRRVSPLFERELLTVRDKWSTLDIQMKLWRLQGYLSFPETAKRERSSVDLDIGERDSLP